MWALNDAGHYSVKMRGWALQVVELAATNWTTNGWRWQPSEEAEEWIAVHHYQLELKAQGMEDGRG
jgi:hypothetical protein